MEKARFEELRFYELGQVLLKAAYRLAGGLPDYEKYNLASQLRRAALSTVLNVAEGYGRYHFPDRLRFFYYARGSLFETLSAFVSAHTIGYIDDEQLTWVRKTEGEAAASLNAYINYIYKQKQGIETFGDKLISEPNSIYVVSEQADSPQFPTPQFPDSPIPDFQFPDPEQEKTHE